MWALESELESVLLNLLVRWPSVHAPFILPSIPPPSTDHHLPASHHQCSQGDERHREEGPQGINFSHGWESSSQKTWQPQTAWLKKKRREEERRRGAQEELKREGILHMMALREGFWILGVFFSPSSKAPCPGWEWANCSSCSLCSPHVAWLKYVGGHQHALLILDRKPTDVLKFEW